MILTARLSSGERANIETTAQESVAMLKAKIALVSPDLDPKTMRLVVRGKILRQETDLLQTYGIVNGDVVHVAKTSISVLPQKPPVPSQDPMEELMSNPMMQSVMSNPALLSSILQSDPRFKQMAEKNPEIRQAMTDPSFLKDMGNAMRNPKLMKEMQRNQDRALSNIESIPGGFTQLSSLFSSFNRDNETPDPSTEEANKNMAERLGVRNSPTKSGPNVQALPNPWAPQSSAVDILGSGSDRLSPFGSSIPNPARNALQDMQSTLSQSMPNSSLQTKKEEMMQEIEMMTRMLNRPNQAANNGAHLNQTADMYNQQSIREPNLNNNSLASMLQGDHQSNSAESMRLQFDMMQRLLGNGPGPQMDSNFLENILGSSSTIQSATLDSPAGHQRLMNPMMAFLQQMQGQQIVQPQIEDFRYPEQLDALGDMGFADIELNKKALLASGGNTESAISYILDRGT